MCLWAGLKPVEMADEMLGIESNQTSCDRKSDHSTSDRLSMMLQRILH